MARFLRDELVVDLTIDEDAISQLVDALFARLILMPEYLQNPQQPDAALFMTIRFDDKGYRVYDKATLLRYFNEASDVDRIVFEMSSGEAFRTNKSSGSYLDLRLDKHELSHCYSTVSSEDENWMNGSFAAVHEILTKHKNYNSVARSPWFELIIQLSGIFLGFIISLWGASQIAPNLTIENSFLISFALVLMVFSNLWGYINQRLKNLVYLAFPKIRFRRPNKEKYLWIRQALIGGIVVAATIYLIGIGFSYVGEMLGTFVGNGT